MMLRDLNCACGFSVPLRPSFLCGMAVGLTGTKDLFVDWICPHCWVFTRFNAAEVPEREFTSFRPDYERHVFHAFLRCTAEDCDAHITVHTLAEENGNPRLPRMPMAKWKPDKAHARCYRGHPLRVPLKSSGNATVTIDR
jgi:hypothetical protein